MPSLIKVYPQETEHDAARPTFGLGYTGTNSWADPTCCEGPFFKRSVRMD